MSFEKRTLCTLVFGILFVSCGIEVHDYPDDEYEEDHILYYELIHQGGLTERKSVRRSGCIDLNKDYSQVVYSNSYHGSSETPFVFVGTLNQPSIKFESHTDGIPSSSNIYHDHRYLPHQFSDKFDLGNSESYELITRKTNNCDRIIVN